jgi:hypothetical protein
MNDERACLLSKKKNRLFSPPCFNDATTDLDDVVVGVPQFTVRSRALTVTAPSGGKLGIVLMRATKIVVATEMLELNNLIVFM